MSISSSKSSIHQVEGGLCEVRVEAFDKAGNSTSTADVYC